MRQAIINLINKWACMHKYKLHKEMSIHAKGYERPVEMRHTLICEKCGKIKKIRL